MLGFLAQTSLGYSRAWIVLFYVTTLAALIVERYVIVRVTAPRLHLWANRPLNLQSTSETAHPM
jgi:hypothetical protein